MKRLLAATVLTAGLVLVPAPPAEAHSIHCAAYVGNPCYRTQALHAWFHQLLGTFGL